MGNKDRWRKRIYTTEEWSWRTEDKCSMVVMNLTIRWRKRQVIFYSVLFFFPRKKKKPGMQTTSTHPLVFVCYVMANCFTSVCSTSRRPAENVVERYFDIWFSIQNSWYSKDWLLTKCSSKHTHTPRYTQMQISLTNFTSGTNTTTKYDQYVYPVAFLKIFFHALKER